MNNFSKSVVKDNIIIFLIFLVFLSVIIIFYIEISKMNKISNSKKNFFVVKETLLKEIMKCKTKEKNWIFGISCDQVPSIISISDYFNNEIKLTNPYDKLKGIEGNEGSVQINIERNNIIILSIDFDASGGIDIKHSMYIN